MPQNIGLLLAAVLLVLTANTDAAVPRRSISDEQIVAQGQLVASGAYVEIYQHATAIDPSFLKVLESAYEEVQRVTGLKVGHGNIWVKGSRLRVGCNRRLACMEGIPASNGSKSHHFP